MAPRHIDIFIGMPTSFKRSFVVIFEMHIPTIADGETKLRKTSGVW